jgi:competence protein ComEA
VRDSGGEAARRLAAVQAARRSWAIPTSAAVPTAGWVPTAGEPDSLPAVGDGGEVGVAADPPGRRVRPVAAVAAAVIAVVVGVAAWLNTQGSADAVEFAPRGSRSAASPASTTLPASAAPPGTAPLSAASPPPSAAGVVVDVEGRVRRPGVQRLPPGSRVADAVRAAGGTTSGALLTALNLARLLADGEQVVVPGPGDPPTVAGAGAGGPALGGAAGSGASGASGGPASASLDLNAATQAGLDALPGIGPVLAERIVAWRTQHGRFTSVDELAEVPGIGPKALERLRPLVRV